MLTTVCDLFIVTFLPQKINQTGKDESEGTAVNGATTDGEQSSDIDREEKKLAKKNRKGMNKNRM